MYSNSLKYKLQQNFKYNENSIYIIDAINDKKYTYLEFNHLVLSMCRYLHEKRIKQESKIIVISENNFDTIVLYFALLYCGAITIPVNKKLQKDELNYIIDSTNCDAIFSLEHIADFKVIDYKNELYIKKEPLIENPFFDLDENKISIIMHSSGTTGKPKGIMHKLVNLYNNAISFGEALNIKSQNRFLNLLSLTYFPGYYNLMFLPFVFGASIVLTKQFDISMINNIPKLIERYNINSLWLVPSIVSILNRFDKNNQETLDIYSQKIELTLIGTAPLSDKLRNEFEEKYKLKLLENYGLSETLLISTELPNIKSPKDSVGKLLDNIEVILNDENEIIVKTPSLMDGYLINSIEDMNIENQTFKTGDIGKVEDNWLFICDRKKDLIIRGGENISPKEIEDIILTLDEVKEVSVIGVEHEIYGEDIVAFIVSDEDSDLQNKVKMICDKKLDSKKIPSKIFITNYLPKNKNGKIDKKELKQIVKDL